MALSPIRFDPRETPSVRADGGWPIGLLKSRILRGRNVYHASTVVLQQVGLAMLAGLTTAEAGPDFSGQYLDRFLGLETVTPKGHMTDDFVERLGGAKGVPFEEALFQAILAVDMSLAFEMHRFDTPGFTKIVSTASPRYADFVWESDFPKTSLAAARVGLAGFVELLPDRLCPPGTHSEKAFATALEALRKRAARRTWSTTTAVLALAAKKRGLPYEHAGGHYLQLGHGAAQHLAFSSITGNTSFTASRLATNKLKANRRLREIGLPVPVHVKASTVDEALAAAEMLGYPVVVKPSKGNQASGVTVGIRNADDVSSAFERAQRVGTSVVVETFVRGRAYRLLVIGGRFVAALQFTPPSVTGDGKKTIAELIDELNSDPLRNGVRLYRVEINDELRASLGLSRRALDDVLGDGEEIPLHTAANVALGAAHGDVTDTVHPDNQELAIRATAAIGLDVAGVDIVTTDISKPLKEVGGVIIEVNSRPGLCMHTLPRYGKPRDVAGAVLDLAFPSGAAGRIPIAVIAGDRGTMPVAQDLDALLRASGKTVGLNGRKGSLVNGQAVEAASRRQHDAARFLLRDPRVETIVSTTSPSRILQQGLGFDTCTVAAIMRPAADGDVETFQRGIEVLVSGTTGIVVVNAANKLAIDAIGSLEPRRIVLLTQRVNDGSIERHLKAGGIVVVPTRREGNEIIQLRRASETLASVPFSSIGTASGNTKSSQLQAQMLAVALAFGLGLSGPEIELAMARCMELQA